jgi:hypothetical protein
MSFQARTFLFPSPEKNSWLQMSDKFGKETRRHWNAIWQLHLTRCNMTKCIWWEKEYIEFVCPQQHIDNIQGHSHEIWQGKLKDFVPDDKETFYCMKESR